MDSSQQDSSATGNADESDSPVRRILHEAAAQATGNRRLSAPQVAALQLRASRLTGSRATSIVGQNASADTARASLLFELSQADRSVARTARSAESMGCNLDPNRANFHLQALLLQQEQSLRETRLLLQRQDEERRSMLAASTGGHAHWPESKSNEDDVTNANLLQVAATNRIRAGVVAQLDRNTVRLFTGEGKDDYEEDEGEEVDDDTYFASLDTEDSHTLNNETFPFRLYRMLYEVEKKGKADIVSFCSNGKVLCIHRSKKFLSEIMPEYFSTSRLASFQRQLNLYGFVRINEGRLRGGYHHEFFQKGKRHLCRKIKRQKTRQSRQSIESAGSASTASLEARAAEILAGSQRHALLSLSHQDQLGGMASRIMPTSVLGNPNLNAPLGLTGLMDSTAAAGGPTMRNLALANPFQRRSLLSMAQESQQLSAALSQERQRRQSSATQQQLNNLHLFARLNQSLLEGSQQRPNSDTDNEGKKDRR